MAENLVSRSGVWYARVQAPKSLKELRAHLGLSGQKDVWRSLGTKDKAEAKRALPDALKAIYSAFDAEEAALRADGARALTTPQDHDLERATWDFIRAELHLDEQGRLNRPTARFVEHKGAQLRRSVLANPPRTELGLLLRPEVLEFQSLRDAAEMDAERRACLAEELREHLAANEFALVDWAIRDLAYRNAWRLEPDSREYKVLGRRLIRGWLQALETASNRDQGVYENPATERPSDPQPSAQVVQLPGKPRKGESLGDYFDAYLRETKSHMAANGLRDARATLRQFRECCGNKTVQSYTKADMATFKRLLTQAPARSEKLYPGVPLPKAVERNRKDGHALLKGASIRNKLSTMSAFGKWLEQNLDGVDADSFSTTLPPRKDSDRMEPFNDDEVRSPETPASTAITCRSLSRRMCALHWRSGGKGNA